MIRLKAHIASKTKLKPSGIHLSDEAFDSIIESAHNKPIIILFDENRLAGRVISAEKAEDKLFINADIFESVEYVLHEGFYAVPSLGNVKIKRKKVVSCDLREIGLVKKPLDETLEPIKK